MLGNTYKISILIIFFSLTGCADKQESIEQFSYRLYQAALSGDVNSIEGMQLPLETYADIILDSKCPSTNCSKNAPTEVRKAIMRSIAIKRISISSYEKLEQYYNLVNGKGFKIKNISITNLEQFASTYPQVKLDITILTPKTDILLTIENLVLLDEKWKIIEGYTITVL